MGFHIEVNAVESLERDFRLGENRRGAITKRRFHHRGHGDKPDPFIISHFSSFTL
jgi:hypothetical protein